MPSLYALLVGIDDYPIPGHKLDGCVNDATVFRGLLESRYDGLHALSLLNEQATRSKVIDSFRKHLGQAQAGDVALFFFAGHGSQVPTGGLFKEIEPDGLNESLVCYDSRIAGAHDLVDKDVATLISEVTAKGVHLTVVLDSCHSGSATRELTQTAIRQVPARSDAQPASVYLRDPEESVTSRRSAPGATEDSPLTLISASGFIPDTSGLHILLAACQDFQSANECLAGTVHHGAFTYSLLEVLNSTQDALGYEELYQRVCQLVKTRVPNQTPQLEALGGDENRRNIFLGVTPGPLASFFLAYFVPGDSWRINGGLLNAIHTGDSLALYPGEATASDLGERAKAIATATVLTANPSVSTLNIQGSPSLDTKRQYKAVLTARAGRIDVSLQGDPEGSALLRSAMVSSPWIEEGPAPRFSVTAEKGEFRIATSDPNHSAVHSFPQTADGIRQAIASLEHMAKWITHLELKNASSAIPPAAVQFTIIRSDNSEWNSPPLTELELPYTPDASGQLQRPSLRMRITNRSGQVLFIALLAFSESWSIFTGLIPAGVQRLGPEEVLYPYSGEPIHTSISSPSGTETHDHLLLIASTDNFDVLPFGQPPLEEITAATRGWDLAPAPPPAAAWTHDFQTRRLHVRTTRNADQ
jgi:hypothetical protein